MPDLHKIWVGPPISSSWRCPTNSPGFYRYALIMEEASEAERNKASRPYDGVAGFSEEHKQQAAQLLVTAATLSAATRRFVEAATCKSSSPKSTSWAGCIGNGCPIWMASKTLYARRVRNPTCY